MSLSLTRAQQQIDTILVESKGLRLEVKRKNAALGRNSFARGILCLDRATRDFEKTDTLRATLK